MKRTLALVIAVLMVALFACGCTNSNKTTGNPTEAPTVAAATDAPVATVTDTPAETATDAPVDDATGDGATNG